MLRKVLMVVLGFFSVLYLINPGAGIFELIPDNIPLIGNIDEALATAILIGVLREFGIDLTSWVTPKPPRTSRTVEPLKDEPKN